MNELKKGSNRSFGIVFFIVFSIFSLWPILKGNDLKIEFLFIALFFLILGLINSSILTPINILWIKFGFFLGKIVSPIVMGIIYFGLITPISFLLKIFNKDVLNLKKNTKKTYWKKRENEISNMRNQF
ncbi:SxtJ family membrane protein [Candidatus Pelagibacter sp.]|nr:SxtJ family membrane protein [Candidatus Pelagibacter sp.]